MSSPAQFPPNAGASTVALAAGTAEVGRVTVQINEVDVSNAVPVPVSDAGAVLSVDDGGGSLTVDGAVNATLQAAASTVVGKVGLQVGGSDVANGNPVPVSDGGGSLTVDVGASENFLGKVGGVAASLSATQTTSASPAYSINDAVGGKVSLSGATRVSAGSCQLVNPIIHSKTVQASAVFDVYWFNADPSASTITDNAAFVLAAGDLGKLVGITTHDVARSLAGSSQHKTADPPVVVKLASGTTVYAAIVAKTSFTAGGTSDIALNVTPLQD